MIVDPASWMAILRLILFFVCEVCFSKAVSGVVLIVRVGWSRQELNTPRVPRFYRYKLLLIPLPDQTNKQPNTESSTMQNESGDNVDLYIPRKCSWTHRLVESKDHASVQVNVANVDPVTGIATGESKSYCLAGYIRFKSEGDMALTELVRKADQESA